MEHCIGLLKNRFRSLRGLRTIISDEASAKRVIDRITVCIILHNLLMDTSYPNEWIVDGLEEELEHPDLDYDYDEQHIPHPYEALADGRSRRDEMMNFVLQYNQDRDE